MQKFIKNLVWVLSAALLSPFVLAGFLAATAWGCVMVGFDVAEIAFTKLTEWVQSDD
jgi:hypothetical protein